MERVMVPDSSKTCVNESMSLRECKEECLGDCSCVAFTSENEVLQSGCVTWHSDMNDTRTYTQAGQNLYVRVDKHELGMYSFLLRKILRVMHSISYMLQLTNVLKLVKKILILDL
ncbi:unnamed protein product [Trifolium pratense]|uniref:Uncharacterized protein n=1 Tax=Trifolium pratense TaxID=57577 RepID=A0ACB0MDC5_TRIPR|nr:unnamed protein product [Trifolium pratense]